MKFFVFLCCTFVFVRGFPVEDFDNFEGHDVAVEVQTNGGKLDTLVRNKRQFSPYQPRSFQPFPAPSYSFMPHMNIPPMPPPNPWSGTFLGGGSTVGGRLNYDVPRGGASVIGTHTFGSNPNTRVGVEGRLNLINDRVQQLSLNAGHMTNLGPGPKMPENTVGVTYRRSFG